MFNVKTILIQVSVLSSLLGATQIFAAGGDVAWVVKQATITTDSHGHMFRQTFYPNHNLARIDRKTGQDIWTHGSTHSIHANASCNVSDKVFIVANDTFEALDPLDGSAVWTVPGVDDSASFYCEPGFDSLILTSGYQNTVVRIIDKTTGELKWRFEAGGAVSYTTKDDQNIYLQKFEDGVPTVIALNQSSGRMLWSRTLNGGDWSFNDVNGHIYIGSKNSYQRLDRANGGTLWTASGDGSEEYLGLQTFKTGVVFTQQGRHIRRLDGETGSVLWDYTLPPGEDGVAPNATFLSNGQLVVNALDATRGLWSFSVLNDLGQVQWQRQADAPNSALMEDSTGNLFIKGPSSLTALNKDTGANIWSFVRETPAANQSIFFFDTYGDDIFVTYGIANGKYPPMGLIRLDAKTGVLQWDKWINETLSIVTADNELVVTEGPMGSRIVSYKR